MPLDQITMENTNFNDTVNNVPFFLFFFVFLVAEYKVLL